MIVLGVLVLALGVVSERPLISAGGVGVIGWLVGAQIVAVWQFKRTIEGLTVETAVDRPQVLAEDPVQVALSATATSPPAGDTTVSFEVPPGTMTSDDRQSVTLTPDTDQASTAVECRFQAPGEYTIPAPTVELRDERDLFGETLTHGDGVTVTVTARHPERIHVGQAGDRVATAYGQHAADQGSGGTTPAELREYAPGDSVDQIDWNATARLGDPYVREFEAETDRETHFVVDHRATTDTGRAGTTALDYARGVALGLVDAAETAGDPVGCWTVGDGGLTTRIQAGADVERYAAVRQHLRELTPTDQIATDSDDTSNTQTATTSATETDSDITLGVDTATSQSNSSGAGARPAVARQRATQLRGETSKFAQKLRPFFEETQTYVARMSERPLYGTIEQLRSDVSGQPLVVIVTDDTRRQETREAVRRITGSADVLVFLTPLLLYDEGPKTDLEAAYHEYVEFEEFRRELSRLGGVEAYEIGPQDQLDVLLRTSAEARA